MGLRYLNGLGATDWVGIAQARCVAPFMSVDDFVRRTTLSEDLPKAGAFDGLSVDRRTVLWDVQRVARTRRNRFLVPLARTHTSLNP